MKAKLIPKLASIIAVLMVIAMADAASAASWYLMAGDAKALSEPDAASLMSRGSSVGPVHFVARGEFPDHAQCEAARRKLIHEFRTQGVIGRGGWVKHGISSPSVFTQCVESTNPRLVKASAPGAAGPAMDVLIHTARKLR